MKRGIHHAGQASLELIVCYCLSYCFLRVFNTYGCFRGRSGVTLAQAQHNPNKAFMVAGLIVGHRLYTHDMFFAIIIISADSSGIS